MVDVPWDIAVGGDLVYPGVEGRRTLRSRLINAYLGRLHAAAAHDATLGAAFLRVTRLVSPPQSLLHPGVALRVLRAGRLPGTGSAAAGDRDAVPAAPTWADHAS